MTEFANILHTLWFLVEKTTLLGIGAGAILCIILLRKRNDEDILSGLTARQRDSLIPMQQEFQMNIRRYEAKRDDSFLEKAFGLKEDFMQEIVRLTAGNRVTKCLLFSMIPLVLAIANLLDGDNHEAHFGVGLAMSGIVAALFMIVAGFVLRKQLAYSLEKRKTMFFAEYQDQASSIRQS